MRTKAKSGDTWPRTLINLALAFVFVALRQGLLLAQDGFRPPYVAKDEFEF